MTGSRTRGDDIPGPAAPRGSAGPCFILTVGGRCNLSDIVQQLADNRFPAQIAHHRLLVCHGLMGHPPVVLRDGARDRSVFGILGHALADAMDRSKAAGSAANRDHAAAPTGNEGETGHRMRPSPPLLRRSARQGPGEADFPSSPWRARRLRSRQGDGKRVHAMLSSLATFTLPGSRHRGCLYPLLKRGARPERSGIWLDRKRLFC